MELNLNRVDYLQVGITSAKCLRLLPGAVHKAQQKVAIGDNDGSLQVFSMKKGEVILGFRTLPEKSIKRLNLGGALGTLQDKIFVCSGNEVRGYTKKGKQFLGFDTNITEEIQSMHVNGSDLLVCGDYVYNHYRDCQDVNYMMAPDKIRDVISLPLHKGNILVPILACEDRLLRVLKDSEVQFLAELPSSPSCLHLFYNDGGEDGDQVMYGTVDGRVGLVQIGKNSALHKWICEGKERSGGEVTSIDHHDMTGDGVKDLIVGKDGGVIEVYSYDDGDESEPTLRFSTSVNESVTAVQGGTVGNAGYDEIVASTYTGWIFGLTTEPLDKHLSSDMGVIQLSEEAKEKIQKLRNEIEGLQHQVLIERDKYQASTQSTLPVVSAVPTFSVNEKNGNYLLATYRCQANTTRLEVKIRTIEGQYGTLSTYITPRIQPKCCQVRKFRIKPLSLHTRIHNFDPNRPYNTLTLKGKFSLPEMHAWISYCLPGVPERIPASDAVEFTFMSTFLDTQLQCIYSAGEAVFQSDNISTISILKDVLTKEATRKKVSLIDALRELSTHEEDVSFLAPEYRHILNNADELQAQFKKQPCHLERLYGMITDLYIDKHKFKGTNVKSRVPQLLEILDNYGSLDLQHLVTFFHAS